MSAKTTPPARPAQGRRNVSFAVLLLAALGALSACNPLTNIAPTESAMLPTRTLAPRRTVPAVTPAPSRTPPPSATVASASAAPSPTAPAATPRPLSMAGCAVTTLDVASPAPRAKPSNGTIAFVNLQGNIAFTDGSSAPQALTNDARASRDESLVRVYKYPAFSADGKSLAFVEFTLISETRKLTQTLRVAPLTARAAATRLYTTTENNIPYIDWSPDGKSLAFVSINADNGGEMRLATLADGHTTVVDTGSSAYWNWRPDSGQLLMHLSGSASRNDDAHLSVLDVATRKVARLKSLPGNFRTPQFSPDGKFMLYATTAGTGDELVIGDSLGKPLCAITPINAGAAFAWSPDGQRIAWLDTSLNDFDPVTLNLFDLTTGKATHLHDQALAFFWSPDSKRLAVYSLVDDGQPVQLEGSDAVPSDSSSPATLLRIEIVDVSSAMAVKVADTIPTGEYMQTIMGYFDQYARGMTPWSPDGTRLVFFSITPGGDSSDVAIATVNESGSAVTLKRIAPGVMPFWSPR